MTTFLIFLVIVGVPVEMMVVSVIMPTSSRASILLSALLFLVGLTLLQVIFFVLL